MEVYSFLKKKKKKPKFENRYDYAKPEKIIWSQNWMKAECS